ncbi:MAG: helix-turn-helix domain-containing protein [Candidatus Dormiibacterota bacterium]
MRELSVAEQRYRAVLAVIGEGKTVTEVAAEWRVSRQTVHTWLARYEVGGLEALGDGSHRPAKCPHTAARYWSRRFAAWNMVERLSSKISVPWSWAWLDPPSTIARSDCRRCMRTQTPASSTI